MKRKAKNIRPNQPNVIKYANHLQACSCMGCGNPRHHFKGKEKITMQERRIKGTACDQHSCFGKASPQPNT